MRLGQLTGLDQDKLRNEYAEVEKMIAYYKEILADESVCMKVVKDELLEIKEKYGDERKTEIIYSSEEFNAEDFYADDETYGKYLQVFSDQMEYSRTRPFTPSWPQIEDTLGIDLQGYMFNKTDDAQASLDKAVEDVNKILAEEDK